MMHRHNDHLIGPNRPTTDDLDEYFTKYIEQLPQHERERFDSRLLDLEDKYIDKIRGNGMQQCPNHGIRGIPGTSCKGEYLFEHREIYRLMNVMHNDEIQSMLLVVNGEWVIYVRCLIMYCIYKGYFKNILSFISSKIKNLLK